MGRGTWDEGGCKKHQALPVAVDKICPKEPKDNGIVLCRVVTRLNSWHVSRARIPPAWLIPRREWLVPGMVDSGREREGRR